MLWLLGFVWLVALFLLFWRGAHHKPTPRPPLPCDWGEHLPLLISFCDGGVVERCMACGHEETRAIGGMRNG